MPLRPQSFAVLRHLAGNPGRLVTKDELTAAVWPEVAVTDDSLVQCIHEIRRRSATTQHVVLQTAARRGYRLVLPEPVAVTPPAGASIAVLPFDALDPGGDGGLLRGRAGRGSDHQPLEDPRALRDRPQLVLRLSGRGGRPAAGRGRARRALSAAGQRPAVGRRAADQRAAGRRRLGRAGLGRTVRRAAADVFALQDRLTEQIVGAIEPSIRRAEIERARRKHPESLDAYDLYLRRCRTRSRTPRRTATGRSRLLDAALALDPGYLPAHGYAAWCHEQRYFRGGFDPADREAALRHADAALAVNADDPQAMSIGAFVRANLTRDYDGAAEVLDRALAMNGNSALAFGFSALVAAHSERHERAVAHAGKALRLSPLDDPLNYHPYCALALTNLFAGRFAEVGQVRLADDPRQPRLQRALRLSRRRPGEPRQPRGRAGGGRAPARGRAGVLGRRLRADGPVPARR